MIAVRFVSKVPWDQLGEYQKEYRDFGSRALFKGLGGNLKTEQIPPWIKDTPFEETEEVSDKYYGPGVRCFFFTLKTERTLDAPPTL